MGTKLILLASSAWLTKLGLIGGGSEAERKRPPLRVRISVSLRDDQTCFVVRRDSRYKEKLELQNMWGPKIRSFTWREFLMSTE